MLKKIFVLLICFQMCFTTAFSAPLITDDFAEESLGHLNFSIPKDYHDEVVQDDIVNKFLKPKFHKVIPVSIQSDVIVDEFASKLDKSNLKVKKVKTKYNFSKPVVEIELKLVHNLATKKGLKEGDKVLFKTVKNIKLPDINIPKGAEIIGRVETVSQNDLMGTPEDVVIDNFTIKDHTDINLYGAIRRRGADRSWWVYPLYQAGNIVFFAAGYPLVLIRGGRVKLSTKDVYTVYYEYQ